MQLHTFQAQARVRLARKQAKKIGRSLSAATGTGIGIGKVGVAIAVK